MKELLGKNERIINKRMIRGGYKQSICFETENGYTAEYLRIGAGVVAESVIIDYDNSWKCVGIRRR